MYNETKEKIHLEPKIILYDYFYDSIAYYCLNENLRSTVNINVITLP